MSYFEEFEIAKVMYDISRDVSLLEIDNPFTPTVNAYIVRI